MRKNNDREIIRLAQKRINYLFNLALENRNSVYLSSRYLTMAEAIGRRLDITLPRYIKRMYCKRCKLPYMGNSFIRLRSGIITIRCKNCGDIRRIPY